MHHPVRSGFLIKLEGDFNMPRLKQARRKKTKQVFLKSIATHSATQRGIDSGEKVNNGKRGRETDERNEKENII